VRFPCTRLIRLRESGPEAPVSGREASIQAVSFELDIDFFPDGYRVELIERG